jgi:Type II secretion system (T2SS), protein E, N-terminal domain
MAATQVAKRVWRVQIDRADVVFQLRDYFRRLGLAAEVRGPTCVEIEADLRDADMEAHLDSWATVTGVPARLEGRPAAQAMLLPPPSELAPPRLGTLLVRKGMITEDQLAVALTDARASNDLVGRVLLRNGWIFEDELARTLSEQLDLPYVSIMRLGVDARVTRLLPIEVGQDVAAIPVRTRGEAIQVAFADPTDQRALASVQQHLKAIDVAVAELSDIMLAWRQVAPRRS